MNARFLVFVLLTVSIIAVAQNVITRELNLPRSGDVIEKQRIEYVNPGEKGENVIWDMSSIVSDSEKVKVFYKFYGDSCFGAIEKRTRYSFKIAGDTLYNLGFENNLTLLRDSVSPIEMLFPMNFGKSLTSDFYYSGKYSDVRNIAAKGTSRLTVDAYGTLILPDGDTLKNVLRTYTLNISRIKISKGKDILHIGEQSDTLPEHKEEIYRWYAAGYRYPIIETVCHTYSKASKPLTVIKNAYFYSPNEQSYALNDEKNRKNRETTNSDKSSRDINNGRYNRANASTMDNNNGVADGVADGITINSDDSQINLNYNLNEVSETEIILTDALGRVYYHSPKSTTQAGNHSQYIDRSKLNEGEYIVSFIINGKPQSQKFTLH